jgi:hypothetical protein
MVLGIGIKDWFLAGMMNEATTISRADIEAGIKIGTRLVLPHVPTYQAGI